MDCSFLLAHNFYCCSSAFSALRIVNSLTLSICQHIRAVSALVSVPILDLIRCFGFIDLSNLGNVLCRSLAECHSVTYVSTLGKVHTFQLSQGC